MESTGVETRELLVLNAGSSSMKFALFSVEGGEPAALLSGQLDGIGTRSPRLTAKARTGERTDDGVTCQSSTDALVAVLDWLGRQGVDSAALLGVGHRIVHGGARYDAPVVITPHRLAELDGLRSLAPLHNGFGLDAIHATLKVAPAVPQVACFDTAFHTTQPDLATRLPLPRHLHDEGFRRFGFHGLNYEHVVADLPRIARADLPERLLVLHLGNGCSLCAIRNGKSVATSMGYSTLDGLVMGTRTGSIDPGVLIALMRTRGMSLDALETLLYRQSGLLGLSGRTSDMRELLEARADPACREAVEHFCYSAARQAASAMAAMGGLDAVVFTGGIGANAAPVRAGIIAHLGWLGLRLDEDANAQNAPLISARGAERPIWIVPANEELTIAHHVLNTVGASG